MSPSKPFHLTFIYLTDWQRPNKLNGVTKVVNGITQRFQQRLDHAVSTASTLDALQDRIVQLEKEIDRLKSDNDQLKALKEKVAADAESLKKKHNVQKQRIEQIAEERDDALQRLEKLEVTFRGCFSQDRPGVSLFGRHVRSLC
jgi:chromosome segregation ATPase